MSPRAVFDVVRGTIGTLWWVSLSIATPVRCALTRFVPHRAPRRGHPDRPCTCLRIVI